MDKKKLVITGGSRGIGRIIADGLVSDYDVVIISKNENSLTNITNDLNVKCYKADVSNFEEIKTIFDKIGNFDILINCAGILGPVANFKDNDLEEWYKTININLFGTVNCCKVAIPLLEKNKTRAKIINISGGGSAYSRPQHTAYACSKTAVVRFTEILADELKDESIDVNVIAPGAHNTDLWKEETVEIKPEKWADPIRLIDTIKFFASDKSDNISGRFIHIRDNWETLKSDVSKSDLFTLRRIDNWKFEKIKDRGK